MNTRKFTIGSIIFLILMLGILAVGQIDYNFSKLMLNQDAIWAKFFNLFGELPAYLCALLGVVILYITRNNEDKVLGKISTIIGVIVVAILCSTVLYIPVKYFFEFSDTGIPSKIFFFIALVGILMALVVYFIGPKYKNNLVKFRVHSIFLICLVVSTTLIVSILKVIWGRPRMRSISSIDEFNYWYQIAGPAKSEEFKSFPSGHTAKGFALIGLSVFAPYIKLFKFNIILAFGVIWGVCVALSRVVIGAHF